MSGTPRRSTVKRLSRCTRDDESERAREMANNNNNNNTATSTTTINDSTKAIVSPRQQ